MSRSWIKIDEWTPNKPHVYRVANVLGVNRDEAFGMIVRFWMNVQERGNIEWTEKEITSIIGNSQFARAMCLAGWLEQSATTPLTFVVTSFNKHFSGSKK